MAPPTIAPPINPPTTAALTPRCALAGVAASEAAIVATATKAANVFFISWALLGLAAFRQRRVEGESDTPYSKLAVSPKGARRSIQSKRAQAGGLKKRFFQAGSEKRPRKQRFPGTLICL